MCGSALLSLELCHAKETPRVTDLTGPPLSADFRREHECRRRGAPPAAAPRESPVRALCAPGMEPEWRDRHAG